MVRFNSSIAHVVNYIVFGWTGGHFESFLPLFFALCVVFHATSLVNTHATENVGRVLRFSPVAPFTLLGNEGSLKPLLSPDNLCVSATAGYQKKHVKNIL